MCLALVTNIDWQDAFLGTVAKGREQKKTKNEEEAEEAASTQTLHWVYFSARNNRVRKKKNAVHHMVLHLALRVEGALSHTWSSSKQFFLIHKP